MKLSDLLKKVRSVVKGKDGEEIQNPTSGEVIVLKEKKNSVLIKCWRCGKELWVKRGSYCHTEGLCGLCIQN